MDFNQSEERVDGMSTASQEVNFTNEQIEVILKDNNRLREECRVIVEQAIEMKEIAQEQMKFHAEAWRKSICQQVSDWNSLTGQECFNKYSKDSIDLERIVCDIDDEIGDYRWESVIDASLDVYQDGGTAEITIEKSIDNEEKIDMIDKIANAVIEKLLSGEYWKEVDNG